MYIDPKDQPRYQELIDWLQEQGGSEYLKQFEVTHNKNGQTNSDENSYPQNLLQNQLNGSAQQNKHFEKTK